MACLNRNRISSPISSDNGDSPHHKEVSIMDQYIYQGDLSWDKLCYPFCDHESMEAR